MRRMPQQSPLCAVGGGLSLPYALIYARHNLHAFREPPSLPKSSCKALLCSFGVPLLACGSSSVGTCTADVSRQGSWLTSAGAIQVTTLLSKAENAQAGEAVSEDEIAETEKEVAQQGCLVSQIKEAGFPAHMMHRVSASNTCARASCMQGLGSF